MNPKLTSLLFTLPQTNRDLLDWNNQAFYEWQSERISSGGYAPSGTDCRDRYGRCYDAATDGADGSTYEEHIQDFRDWSDEVFDQISRQADKLIETDSELDQVNDAFDSAREACTADIDRCEAWHEAHGSLTQQVG